MQRLARLLNKTEDDWISISDLMAGLMMIFLFIAISYMNSLQIRANQIKRVAIAYQELQADLYSDLYDEFKDDLIRWDAEIERETLSIRFNEPDVLFVINSSEVRSRFKGILNEFFPRYLNIMYSPKYRDSIEEIRIEGHTSSEWNRAVGKQIAYILNMELSQDRTRSVLEYCLNLIKANDSKAWARKYITANGLSSSHLILTEDGKEQMRRSRRVEFRTKTAAERKVVEIIREIESSNEAS